MKSFIVTLLLVCGLSVNGWSAILVLQADGSHTTVTTLEIARTQGATANKTIVVTSALTEAQSNITAAWPADRALKVEKGGSIANSTAFTINGPFSAGDYQVFAGAGAVTGLHDPKPAWFGAKADFNGVTGTDNSGPLTKTFAAAYSGSTIRLSGWYMFNSRVLASNKTNIRLTGGVLSPVGFIEALDRRETALLFMEDCKAMTIENIKILAGDNSGMVIAGIVYYNTGSGSSVINSRIELTNNSEVNTGIVVDNDSSVATPARGVRISGNTVVGGNKATANGTKWDDNIVYYRGSGIVVGGDDIDVIDNIVTNWTLGAIKLVVNFFKLETETDYVSHRQTCIGNTMTENSQQDIGATGIGVDLTITGNTCSSVYTTAVTNWRRCNSIHLKGGFGWNGAAPGLPTDPTKRLENVVVSGNACRSNITVRSYDEVTAYPLTGNNTKNVLVSGNTIVGSGIAGDDIQGISVSVAQDVAVIGNLIVDTPSYPVAISGAYRVQVKNNVMMNTKSLQGYIQIADVDSTDANGRSYEIDITDNSFTTQSGLNNPTDTIRFDSLYGKIADNIRVSRNIDRKGTVSYSGTFPGTSLTFQNNHVGGIGADWAAAAPTSGGPYGRSSFRWNTVATAGAPLGWVNVSSGSPGTWGAINGPPLTGAGVPGTTPVFIGAEYLDTTNSKWYKAKGINSSADWLILN